MDHPLRAIRAMVDEVLTQLSGRFDTMNAHVGRPSIAPEKLLRAQLHQILYSSRSERLSMEEVDYNLLCRWFVGLADYEVWDAPVFARNRDLLPETDMAKEFLPRVVEQAGQRADQRRTLYRRGHAARGLGGHEELSAGERKAVVSGRRWEQFYAEL
jgi:transposase